MNTNKNTAHRLRALVSELRRVAGCGRQVWALVSRRRKCTFLFVTVLMLIGAGATTLVGFWLGGLVDAMEGKRADALTRAPLAVFGLSDAHEWTRIAPGPEGGQDSAGRPARSVMLRIAFAYILLIAMAYIIKEALQVVRKCIIENTCTRMEKETLIALVSHLLRIDLARLSADRVGALHGRIHRSVEGFVKFFKLAFMDFFPAVFLAACALMGAAIKQPWIAALMAAVIPASLIITVRQILSQKGIRVELIRKREGLDGTVVEQLAGIEYIRAANTLPLELERVENVAEERRAKEVRHHVAMALFDSAKALNEGFFYIAMVSASIYLAVNGYISIGSIVTFSSLYLGVMAPLRELHRILDEAHESSIRVSRLMEMMSEPVDHSFRLPTIRRPAFEPGKPVIVAEHLQMEFRNGDGRVRRALDGVSMVIRGGETIGVAGPSGSGKSTWLKCVMRLVHPTGGRLVLGGEPIEAISRDVIGDTIGYVSQTPFVFAGTVAENIAYGAGCVSPQQVEQSARLAYIHDEITAMPDGYQTLLTERGQNLSGGQRQRIALARIFLRNPPVLILDEGTSALDNISERKIQQALAAARHDRTVILVAHRLSTLRDADRILVFSEGRLAEVGTYDQLWHQDGVFTELLRSAGGNRTEPLAIDAEG